MKRTNRKEIAHETKSILESGYYQAPDGSMISLEEDLKRTWENTRCYSPEGLADTIERESASLRSDGAADITAVNQTSLQAARDLLEEGADEVVCLNFASAKNPGGGFLGGAEAQEEAICRPSALYASLLKGGDSYYRVNRLTKNALYTDHVIYSPDVAVFRDEADGTLLAKPYHISFVTAPAPNRGALEQNTPSLVSEIESVFRNRIRGVLAVMAENGHRNLVLGAWGCGVFRNDPSEVAKWFHDAIEKDGWKSRFDRIRFGVLDRRDCGTFQAFEEELALQQTTHTS